MTIEETKAQFAEQYRQLALALMKRAELGNACAAFQLAEFYLYGCGVERDYKLALRWMNAAAQEGHVDAIEFMYGERVLGRPNEWSGQTYVIRQIECEHANKDVGQIRNLVSSAVSKLTNTEAEDWAWTNKMREEMCLDDLDIVELLMAIEEEYQIEFWDHATATLRSLGDILCYVHKRLRHAQ